MQKSLNPFYRIFIYSVISFWKVVFSRDFADQVYQVSQGGAVVSDAIDNETPETAEEKAETPEPTPEPAKVEEPKDEPKEEPKEEPQGIDGMYLLSLFQKSGRLVDFLQEDITEASNEDLGEALRVVHEGCSEVLKEYFIIESVYPAEDGDQVTVDANYDPTTIRLSGNVQGKPPFTGELIHHGWKVKDFNLPQRMDSHNLTILAPAEVEI